MVDATLDITDPKLKKLVDLCKEVIPSFKLTYKTDSKFMKVLGTLSKLFNPEFMTVYTTTVGSTVYLPSKEVLLADQRVYFGVLAHELVHMREQRQTGSVLYMLKYFAPQILGVLALLAIFAVTSVWFLLALFFLIALAPLPSPGRANIELNGYTMSMAVDFWFEGSIGADELEWIALQFTGAPYYFMWPFRGGLMKELKARAVLVRTHKVLEDSLFRDVFNIVKDPNS